MPGSSPPDAHDPDERRREGDAELPAEPATTEVLPGRSTLLLDEGEGERTTPEPIAPPEPVAPAEPITPPERRDPARPVSRTTLGIASDSYAAASSLGEESRFSSALDALRHDEIRR